jgi:hypothetical protein
MPVSTQIQQSLYEMLPSLKPQVVTPQLERTMEFEQAELELKLKVIALDGVDRIIIMCNGDGPYYIPIWAYRGRPYIRVAHGKGGFSVDVFLLPKD